MKNNNPSKHLKIRFLELVSIDFSICQNLRQSIRNNYTIPFNNYTIKSLLK